MSEHDVQMRVGEVEAVLDLLIAVQAKGQWLERLRTAESVHLAYFEDGLQKAITMLSGALPVRTEPFGEET